MAETGKNFCPSKDGVDNLGKSGKAWGKTYTKDLNVSGTADIHALNVSGAADIKKLNVSGFTGILPVAHGGTGLDHLPYTPNVNGCVWDGTHFPVIGPDGVAEVGRCLDFHENSHDTADYSLRLESSGGKLLVGGTDIMKYISDVKSQAGVVAGDVSNANAWWVKLGGAIPLIIQGVIGSGTVPFPISFNHVLSGFAQFDSTVSNDDLWNDDIALFISNSSIRCGGEGRRCYHIGIGY